MPELLSTDGQRLVYDDEGCGRPLLFVHGWATHSGFFAPQRKALAGEFRVICVDMRGHGRSAGSSGAPSMEQLAGDLTALCRALALKDAVAVGWSMGAMALWGALLKGAAPHIAGQVIIDMSPRILNGPGWSLGLKGSQNSGQRGNTLDAMRRDWAAYAPRIAQRLFAEGMSAERQALERWSAGEIAKADAEAMAGLWASLLAQDFRAALPSIETPALVIHGAQSRLYPAETAHFLAMTLPRAERRSFSASGHAPHLEEADAFNRILADFARSVSGEAAAGMPTKETLSGRIGQWKPHQSGS